MHFCLFTSKIHIKVAWGFKSCFDTGKMSSAVRKGKVKLESRTNIYCNREQLFINDFASHPLFHSTVATLPNSLRHQLNLGASINMDIEMKYPTLISNQLGMLCSAVYPARSKSLDFKSKVAWLVRRIQHQVKVFRCLRVSLGN